MKSGSPVPDSFCHNNPSSKLNETGDKPRSAREFAIADAIAQAERVLQKIDERWPGRMD